MANGVQQKPFFERLADAPRLEKGQVYGLDATGEFTRIEIKRPLGGRVLAWLHRHVGVRNGPANSARQTFAQLARADGAARKALGDHIGRSDIGSLGADISLKQIPGTRFADVG